LWEEEYRFQKANGDFANVKDRGHIIYDKNNLAKRMIGATTDISEKVKLENNLDQERLIKQSEITDAILTAQENERAVIGTELYENLNQVLAASKIYIELAKKYEHKRDVYLEKSSAFIQSVMKDIQKISKSLVIPGQLFGLKESIQNSIADILNIHPMKIEFFCTDFDEKDLDEKLQINIFRIVQEQLNNVLSHAQATGIFISLSRNESEIKLLISDNGIGCDLSKEGTGVGIKNIKSRAGLYNGRVGILSNPGEGYDIRVVMLLPKTIPIIDVHKPNA
jgi:signal transduction histidine kinase